MKKSSLFSVIFRVFQYLMLIAASLVALIPVCVCILTAFKTTDEYNNTSVLDMPASFLNFENFQIAFEKAKMLSGFLNTTIVLIVVLTGSMLAYHGGKVVLQRQYRYPISSWQWELPGGFVDEGELPEEAARRELKEETGLEAVNLRNLGAFYPSFGSTDEKIHLFSAECGNPGESEKEPGEVLYQEEIAEKTFREMIADGRFMHGAGLAAWARYQAGTPQDSADESRRFVS
ncbi:MAG: NUDIX domain-containing protein [Lachnospiraceae bacterium]|nr:NUDIX domain-containing protein [Lachnospiraceae bacterium]